MRPNATPPPPYLPFRGLLIPLSDLQCERASNSYPGHFKIYEVIQSFLLANFFKSCKQSLKRVSAQGRLVLEDGVAGLLLVKWRGHAN